MNKSKANTHKAGPHQLSVGRSPSSASSGKGQAKLKMLPVKRDAPKVEFGTRKVLPKIKSTVERFKEILRGSFTDLLPKTPTEVRIFLSSTFSDYRSERNRLVREAIPELKEFCAENGLDFRMVDMRWGINDDATNEHVTGMICQAEIANCQRVSLGPNFVALLGNRFGYQPLPIAFVAKEFDILYAEAKNEGHPEVEMLKEWYARDDNNMPPIYYLKPIRDVLPHFGDHTPGNEEARKLDTGKWNQKHHTLHDVLRCAVTSLAKKKIITASRKHDFYKSVTEMEVTDGILEAVNPTKHALCYLRDFDGLTGDRLNDTNASRNVDCLKKEDKLVFDVDVTGYQSQLKNNHVPAKLHKDNIRTYSVPWLDGGICSTQPEHAQYLNKFCREFVSDVKRLVSNSKQETSNVIPASEFYTDLDEALHHSYFCNKKCESFRGQHEVLNNIRNYLSNKNNRKPLTVYAESGVGKTSVLAMTKKLIAEWFGDDAITVIKFLGTSPNSTHLFDVLRGVMGQLADVFGVLLEPMSYKTNGRISQKIVTYFARYLRNISRKSQQPVFIFLDSIDQLSPTNGAYDMHWLPTELPPRVHLIVSVIPSYGNIYNNIRELVPDDKCFINVKPLPMETGKAIIDFHLTSRGRKVTPEQRDVILQCLKKDPSPLFLKLFLDKALSWRSYTVPDQIRLETSVKEAIVHLFEDLEGKFGRPFIRRALGYITVGFNGLSEVELEDVLSCDDTVLDEVYVYHDPPIEGVIRIPPLLWARVRLHVNEYLAERQSHGKSTLFWYHRQFVGTAFERYASGDDFKVMHRRLAEMYLSEHGVKKDITLSRRKGLVIKKADRQVTTQPMSAENKRMLEALPYHLLNAGNVGYAKQVGLCNLNFLMTRMIGFSLEQVIEDISKFCSDTENPDQSDEELNLLACTLKIARSSLRLPRQMPVELLTRLKYDRKQFPNISNLLKKSREYIECQKEAGFLPLNPCLEDTGELILSKAGTRLSSISDDCTKMVLQFPDESNKICQKVAIYDTSTQRFLREELIDMQSSTCPIVTKDGKKVIQVKKCLKSDPSSHGGKMKTKTAGAKPGDYVVETFGISQDGLSNKKVHVLPKMKVDHLRLASPSRDGSYVSIIYNESNLAIIDLKVTEPRLAIIHETLQCARKITWFGKNVCVITTENEKGNTIFFFVDVKERVEKMLEVPGKVNDHGGLLHLQGDFLICISTENDKNFLHLINMGSAQLVNTVTLPRGYPSSICPAGRKGTLLTSSSEQELFALEYDEQVQLERVGTGCLPALSNKAILANGVGSNLVIVGDETGSIHVYDQRPGGLYNIGSTRIHQTAIRELYCNDNEDLLISLSQDHEICVWNWRFVLLKCQIGGKSPNKVPVNSNDISNYRHASKLLFTEDVNTLITLSPIDGIKVWDVCSLEKVKDIPINVDPQTAFLTSVGRSLLILDRMQKKIHAWDIDDAWVELDFVKYLEGTMLALTGDTKSKTVFILSEVKNKIWVSVLDTNGWTIKKTMAITDRFENSDIELALSDSGNYLFFKVQATPKQLSIINESEKRNNLFTSKGSEFFFYALDLKNPTEALKICNRQLTSIPCLGDGWAVQTGDYLVIGRGRHDLIWDPSTGKCDQRLIKGTKDSQFYRPKPIEYNFKASSSDEQNNNCIIKSKYKQVIVQGSADGCVVIYETESGKQLGKQETKRRPVHRGPVTNMAVSPVANWAASYGEDMTLRFWNCLSPQEERANINLGMDVYEMEFSEDGAILAVLGSKRSGQSSVLLFKMKAAKG